MRRLTTSLALSLLLVALLFYLDFSHVQPTLFSARLAASNGQVILNYNLPVPDQPGPILSRATTTQYTTWYRSLPPPINGHRFGFRYGINPVFYEDTFARQYVYRGRLAHVVFPDWVPVVVLAVILTWGGWPAWLAAKARHHRYKQICPDCGYDLRATPTRCPECGRAITPPPPIPTPPPSHTGQSAPASSPSPKTPGSEKSADSPSSH